MTLLYFERKLKAQGFDLIIGVDEAGRGPLAGPVVAAAVALKCTRFKNRIDDSKKLTPLAREKAYPEILAKSFSGIGIVSEQIIDRINILQATLLAMRQAIDSLLEKESSLKEKNIHVIIDGNAAPEMDFPSTGIIRGDARSLSIAASSIVAKVTRDRIMDLYDTLYPRYGFRRHKGYPTLAHRSAIRKLGPSAIHRRTFLTRLRGIPYL